MLATFSRMKPVEENMVIQTNSFADHQLLCVECGWEGSCVSLLSAWAVFRLHPCRLVTESVSTSD